MKSYPMHFYSYSSKHPEPSRRALKPIAIFRRTGDRLELLEGKSSLGPSLSPHPSLLCPPTATPFSFLLHLLPLACSRQEKCRSKIFTLPQNSPGLNLQQVRQWFKLSHVPPCKEDTGETRQPPYRPHGSPVFIYLPPYLLHLYTYISTYAYVCICIHPCTPAYIWSPWEQF